MMFLLFVLQLGAATPPGDYSHDEGQVAWSWVEVLELAAADTGGPQKALIQKMRDEFKSHTNPDLVRKAYGKSPDDMTLGDWTNFYTVHPCLLRPDEQKETFQVGKKECSLEIAQLLQCRFARYVDQTHTLSGRSLAYVRAYQDFCNHSSEERDLTRAKALLESTLSNEQKQAFDKKIMQARIDRDSRTKSVQQAERDILSEVLSGDADYLPGKAIEVAQEFLQTWKTDFSQCPEGLFGPFLQGLWSKLDPADRKMACHVGAYGARGRWGGLAQYLLELKYNTPVVAVAIAQAILKNEAQSRENVLAQGELSSVYEGVSQELFLETDAEAFALGQRYAQTCQSLAVQAVPACWSRSFEESA